MTSLEALVSLNMVDGIGSVRLAKLMEFFGKPENIFKAPLEKLKSVFGIGDEIADQIRALDDKKISRELALADKLGLKIMTWEDKDYPKNLKEIPGAPIVLYIKGALRPQDINSIAIVGSRRASFYGLSCAERFAADLSDAGFTIVSGLARGIDTAAHKGALKLKGRTIAVIGSGFNNIYPEENMELAEEIAKNGAVISEFPVDAKPLPQNFPRRNRIISGLSLGTLVVEAARNSGALITVDFALEQGREVFALPGKVDADNSFGTNELIKQGAKLVSCADDILEEFNLGVAASKPEIEAPGRKLALVVAGQEKVLYDLICNEPIILDDIVEITNLAVPVVSDALMKLEIKKLIKQLPGKQFIRNPALSNGQGINQKGIAG